MSSDYHPAWCDPKHCTAYLWQDHDAHRSEAVVVPTEDHNVSVFIYRAADPDGTGERIELAELEAATAENWHTVGQEFFQADLSMPLRMAAELQDALAAMRHLVDA